MPMMKKKGIMTSTGASKLLREGEYLEKSRRLCPESEC
jgi:hypothetical protein